MNKAGMAIDVSHSGDRTTLDAFEMSKKGNNILDALGVQTGTGSPVNSGSFQPQSPNICIKRIVAISKCRPKEGVAYGLIHAITLLDKIPRVRLSGAIQRTEDRRAGCQEPERL